MNDSVDSVGLSSTYCRVKTMFCAQKSVLNILQQQTQLQPKLKLKYSLKTYPLASFQKHGGQCLWQSHSERKWNPASSHLQGSAVDSPVAEWKERGNKLNH